MIEHEAEMVCSPAAAIPQPRRWIRVSSTLTIARSPGGFFMEYHPKLRPVDSPTDGVFLAGAAQGPKDIPASVAQGSAAASRAARMLHVRQLGDRADRGPRLGRALHQRAGQKVRHLRQSLPLRRHHGRAGQGGAGRDRPSATAAAAAWPNARTTPSPRSTLPMRRWWPSCRRCSRDKPEEKILAFMCHWCSYGGADTAGTSHFEYPATRAACA